MASSSVADRLRSLISQDDAGGAVDGLQEGSAPGGLTDFESSIETWGFVYGLAYALTRLEDPFESAGSVAERAHQVARLEFLAYSGVYDVPEPDRLIAELEEAWEAAHEDAHRGGVDAYADMRLTPGLVTAINQLISTRGRDRGELQED